MAYAALAMASPLFCGKGVQGWSDGRGQGCPNRMASEDAAAALLPYLLVVPKRSSGGRIRPLRAPHLPQTRVSLVVLCSGQPVLLSPLANVISRGVF
jgi:hypothetical protein